MKVKILLLVYFLTLFLTHLLISQQEFSVQINPFAFKTAHYSVLTGGYDFNIATGHTPNPIGSNGPYTITDKYRTALSFDISSIPRWAVLTRAELIIILRKHLGYPGSTVKMKSVGGSVNDYGSAFYLWLTIGNGEVYKSNVNPSDQSQTLTFTWNDGSPFLRHIQDKLAEGSNVFSFGFISNDENTSGSLDHLEPQVTLKIYYRYPGVTFKNNFGGGRIKIDGLEYNTPVTFYWHPSESHTAEAIDQYYGGYDRVFHHWNLPDSTKIFQRVISVHSIDRKDVTYEAEFRKKINITVQNNFSGSGNGGRIKVDGQIVYSPFTKQIIERDSIMMEAITPQTYNSILYVFEKWSDDNTSNPRIETPVDHTTYTANFIKHVSVYITGPSVAPCNVGTWTANVSGGFPPYSYQWYHKWICDGGEPLANKSNIQPLRPCDEWTEVGTNSPTLQMYLCGGSSMLRVVVTDSRGYQAFDEYYVAGSGGIKPEKSSQDIDTFVFNIPDKFEVSNYPNPFNPSAKIKFSLPEDSHVQIKVYDALGREIATLLNEERKAGYHEITFDARDLPSGVYFYRIMAGKFMDVKKMILLK